MKNKILVTGGAGFIGSHLCKKLAEDQNNDVYSLDNYFTGNKYNHKVNVTYIEGGTYDIEKLINFTPNIIYHLGEYSRVEQSFNDIEKVWRYNKDGTIALLEFARKKECKIVYAGSSTKFSNGEQGQNASPYAWIKASNTELVKNYGTWFDLPYAITYLYNVYGPREIKTGNYATIIALFKEKMKNGTPLTVVSPGTQKRNFTHVKDIVDGLVLVGENAHGDGFGIGSNDSYTIKEIAHMFGGEIEMIAERKGNRMSSECLVSKTKALGWNPKRNIRDYIEKLKQNGFR